MFVSKKYINLNSSFPNQNYNQLSWQINMIIIKLNFCHSLDALLKNVTLSQLVRRKNVAMVYVSFYLIKLLDNVIEQVKLVLEGLLRCYPIRFCLF